MHFNTSGAARETEVGDTKQKECVCRKEREREREREKAIESARDRNQLIIV
jgi:hypothetical protein